MKLLFRALIASAFWVSSAWAASGTMIKDDELRQSAMSSSPSLGSVKKGANVEILARKGGWTQVASAGVTGWVRILSVKSSVSGGGGGGFVQGAFQMSTSRSNPSRVVAVAGVRGLNEEELRNTRYNAAELARMDQYLTSRSEAEQFARSAGLRSLELAYFEAGAQSKPQESSRQESSSDSAGGGNSFGF